MKRFNSGVITLLIYCSLFYRNQLYFQICIWLLIISDFSLAFCAFELAI